MNVPLASRQPLCFDLSSRNYTGSIPTTITFRLKRLILVVFDIRWLNSKADLANYRQFGKKIASIALISMNPTVLNLCLQQLRFKCRTIQPIKIINAMRGRLLFPAVLTLSAMSWSTSGGPLSQSDLLIRRSVFLCATRQWLHHHESL